MAADRQAGIGLLEVLITLIIISIAASILLVTSRTSVTGQQRSEVYGNAAAATREALESLKLLTLDSLTRVSDKVVFHSAEKGVEVRATVRGVLGGDVADISRLDTTTLRHVTLKTHFRGEAGAPVVRSFTTLLYVP